MKLQPDMELYKYRLERLIGKGHFSEVWLAVDRAIEREFAVKVLNQGTSIHSQLKEAQIGHTLAHDNLVTVHQADVVPLPDGSRDVVLIAMDYLSRGPVTSLANEDGFLPLPCALKIVTQILQSLEYLHTRGLLHNDIKPDNILIGDDGLLKLTDYGILEIMDDHGAPVRRYYRLHAAPEVLDDKNINPQTDVFQAGLTLFRLLVGLDALERKRAQLGETAYVNAMLKNRLITIGDFPEYIPTRLRSIVRKATHPDLSHRYPSALEMRRALERVEYKGYWTVTVDGLRGFDERYSYRYVEESRDDGFHVAAYRRRLTSGTERKIGKYCLAKGREAQAQSVINSFVRGVVEGL